MKDDRTFGDRVADKVTSGIGSWKFIIIQSVFTVLWIVLNTVAFVAHWDDYPWVLLNLVYSFQAGFTGPILLLSGNRQAAIDRAKVDKDLATDEESLELLRDIVYQLKIKDRPEET